MRDYAAMFRSRFTIGLFDLFDPRPFLADLAPLVLRRFRHAGTPPPEEPPIRI